MAKAADNAVRIIRKVKKSHAHAHHSGAWKVAYADFVTAMMAFFLLLWLLNATTEEQKAGIADYFSPSSASRSTSGAGGVLGGRTLSDEGALQSNRSAIQLTIALPNSDTPNRMAPEEKPARSEEWLDRSAVDEMRARRDEEQFRAAEELLRQAIQSIPDLKQMAQNLIIDVTPEGLRIQLVDQERLSMFPLGSAQMHDHTRRLLELVVGAISKLPHRIAIKGHTDATPYTRQNGYSNWELSTDRANASRRALVEAGLPASRIASVTGRAAEELLVPEDPASPRNRRISITLLRDTDEAGQEEVEAPTGSDEVEIRIGDPAE